MAVDIGKFIKAPEYNVTIVTYRDVFQSAVCEEDRLSSEYQDLSAVIILDAAQMKHMGIVEGSNVRLTSKHGSVVVKTRASQQEEQKNIGFMVNSPWSNALVSIDTSDGFPGYKHIEVTIAVSKDEITSQR